MKLVVLLGLLAFSLAATAFTEVECQGRDQGKDILIVVEGNFPNGSFFKPTRLQIRENGTISNYNYTLTSRGPQGGFNEIRYDGAGLSLRVDLWPDQLPRWGRTYRGEVFSSVLGNHNLSNFSCRYPNVH